MTESSGSTLSIESYLAALKAFFIQEQERVVREAVRSRRAILCAEIVRRLEGSAFNIQPVASTHNEGWVKVFSLTTVRNIVGGRFDLIKARWTSAGLPLKQHRGSCLPEFSKNEEGWCCFVAWLLEQGYEIREDNAQSDVLFEIRKLP